MAIPVVEAFTTKTHSAGSPQSSIVLTKPSGVVVDDLLILFCLSDDNGSDDAFQDTKSGWTVMLQTGNSSSDAKLAIYYRIADGTEASTETVTMDATDDVIGWYLRISGVDTTTPINAQNEGVSSGNASSRNVTGITTTVDDCLVFYALVLDGADGSPFSVSGTGWSESDELETPSGDNTDVSGCWGTKDMASQGATGTASVSWNTSDGHSWCQFAIAPSAGGPNLQTIAATVTGVPVIDTLVFYKRTLSLSAIGVPVLNKKMFMTFAVTASVTPVLVKVRSFVQTIVATAVGVVSLSIVKTFLKTISATATGVSVLTKIVSYKRSLTATTTAIPILIKKMFVTITATTTGVLSLSTVSSYFRALTASATGVVVMTRSFVTTVTLAAVAVVSATMVTVFTEGVAVVSKLMISILTKFTNPTDVS